MKHDDFLKYEQKAKHGTPLFPFAVYTTDIPKYLTFYPAHWHDEIEIVYVLKGKCTYYINFKPYEANAGDIIIIPPTAIHSFEQFQKEHFFGITFVFNLNMINNNSLDICSSKYFLPVLNNEVVFHTIIKSNSIGYSEMHSCIEDIMACVFNEKQGYELRLKMKLLEMFYILFEYRLYNVHTEITADLKEAEQIKQVIQYIEMHYSERITLEMLAKFAQSSVYHFAHRFKKCTGQSPIEYIKQYRISCAAKMLLSTDKTILEIAIQTGFNNISYFNRAFREMFQITPTAYRNNGRR